MMNGAALAFAASLARAQPAPRPRLYAPVATGEPRGRPLPRRTVGTTKMFKAPPSYPNALSPARDGLWVAEQRFDERRERIWRMDWNGSIRETVSSDAKDTSGVAFGDGVLWVCADDTLQPGIFETDLQSHTLSHRQIPLGPSTSAGGGHGATWHEGHLWVPANRPRAILKIKPDTWTVDYLIPFGLPEGLTRYHGCAVLNDSMYMVSGGESRTYAEGQTSLIRYDLASGMIREVLDLAAGSCDPHGLMVHDGRLIACDSGFHPGWDSRYLVPGLGRRTSPTAGWIFSIDV